MKFKKHEICTLLGALAFGLGCDLEIVSIGAVGFVAMVAFGFVWLNEEFE